MRAYAIKDDKGNVLLSTTHRDFATCISNFERVFAMGWKSLVAKGYTCVPVEITEIADKENK